MLAKSRHSASEAEEEEGIWRALQREVARRGLGRWRLPDELRLHYGSDVEEIRAGNSTLDATADDIAETLALHAVCYLELAAASADPTNPMTAEAESEVVRDPSDDRAKDAEYGSADLTRVRAQHVAQRADVQCFRREVLADLLLTPTEVTEWLDRQQAADGPRTIWDAVSVPRIPANLHCYEDVQAMGRRRGSRRLIAFDGLRGVGIETWSETRLLMIVTTPGSMRHIQTAQGGILEDLRTLAHKVAEDVGWFEAEAAAFVLTGEPLPVPLIRDTVVVRSVGSAGDSDRIVMDIDPGVSPRVVAQHFAMLRQTHLQRSRSSSRSVDAKYAAVLEFWQVYGDRDQHERIRQWNASYPDWKINAAQPNALRQLYRRAYRWFHSQEAPLPSRRRHAPDLRR